MKTKKVLTEDEIIEIIEKRLPEIIETHPEVKRKIEEIIEKKTATKDDIKAILLELQKQREETNKRFEMLERENAKRFEAIEKRFEMLERENAKRFEAIERRFEAIDKRFEAMERANAKRFETIERRFESIDKRFEALINEMKKGFEMLDKKIDSRISALGSRWGIFAEDTFRKGFEELLPELGYKVIKWRKMDKACKVFLRPRPAEIDILIRDKKKIAIEIKSSLTLGELEVFERSVRFYEEEEKEKIDKKIIITLFPYPGVESYAKRLKVKIIKSESEAERYLK